MFDIGWSEIAVIAVVALIAIGPKELPGVLRMVGHGWQGAQDGRRIPGQFQEAMREAEMADLKKSFGRSQGSRLRLHQRQSDDLAGEGRQQGARHRRPRQVGGVCDRNARDRAAGYSTTPATSKIDAPEAPIPETFTEADAHAAASQPLAIVQEAQQTQEAQQPAPQDIAPNAPDALKDAKAS